MKTQTRNHLSSLLFALPLVIALCARMSHLTQSGFTIDELVSIDLAEHFEWRNLFTDNHPPLSVLFLKLFTAVSLNELSARLPSVLFSTAAVGLLGVLLRARWGMKMAVVGMLFHALAPLSIEQAQMTRPYAFLEFFALLQFTAFARWEANPTKDRRTRLLVTTFLAIATSYLAVLLFVLELIYLQAKKRNPVWILWTCFILLFAIYSSRELLQWKSLAWQQMRYRFESFGYLPIDPVAAFANYSNLTALGLALPFLSLTIKRRTPDWGRIAPPLIAIFSLLATLIFFAQLSKYSIFQARYFAFALPAAILGFCQVLRSEFAAQDQKQRLMAWLSVALVLGGALHTLQNFYPVQKQKWREASETISIYPHSKVITDLSLNLQFPYFSRYNIVVQPLVDANDPIQQIKFELKTTPNVFILDTYWDYINYQQALLRGAASEKIKVDNLSVIEENSENVVLLRLYR